MVSTGKMVIREQLPFLENINNIGNDKNSHFHVPSTVLHTLHVLHYSEFIATLQGKYYNHILQIREVFQRGFKPGL